MGESRRYPKHFFVVFGQDFPDPLTKGARGTAYIHRHIENLAFDYTYQLTLRLLYLIMQSPENELSGTAVVVLNEIEINTALLVLSPVPALQEKTPIVPEDIGLDKYDIGYGQPGKFHGSIMSFRAPSRTEVRELVRNLEVE